MPDPVCRGFHFGCLTNFVIPNGESRASPNIKDLDAALVWAQPLPGLAFRHRGCFSYLREDRLNARTDSKEFFAGCFRDIDVFGIYTAQQAESAALADAVRRWPREFGHPDSSTLRRRRIDFPLYPRLKTRGPGSKSPGLFFCVRLTKETRRKAVSHRGHLPALRG
jgi:hypothetical protein